MTAHLHLAPAAAGKTIYAINLARQTTRGLAAEARVCVASRLQVHSWRRRLAETGGAIGVRVMTFDELYLACLGAAGQNYTLLEEAVEYRLIQDVIGDQSLVHYRSLRDLPGFPLVLQSFIKELKGARVFPERFLEAVGGMDGPSRLTELGQIYAEYQRQLRRREWADYAGIGWLAVEILEQRAQDVTRDWPLLIVDGFDSFTEIQLDLLQILAGRVGRLVITMTGQPGPGEPRPVHARFHRTRHHLEERLQITAEPLPEQQTAHSMLMAHLEVGLFTADVGQTAGNGAIAMIEAPDRATEAREALRWLKECLVHDGMQPGEVALLGRDLSAYQPFIVEIAAEFGLPIRLLHGLPLRSNPAVAALLKLLSLVLPREGAPGDWSLSRKDVVAAWRSPYFDWSNAYLNEGDAAPIGIMAGEAEALDAAARWGRVIGGLQHWQEMFAALSGWQRQETLDDERRPPQGIVSGPEAQALEKKFTHFLMLLLPPQGSKPFREYVDWLEQLIGSDPTSSQRGQPIQEPRSLNMIERIRQGDPTLRVLDIAALRKVKGILRGLIWAEEGQGRGRAVDYSHFFAELAGAIDAVNYEPRVDPGRERVLVAEAIRARGVPFRAVALLGLAEGQFPATLNEDPFLREADRQTLRRDYGLPLESSIESNEREFFYETVTSPWEKLLLTRPRLSDAGAEWLPSPFWEELQRLVDVEPVQLTTESVPAPIRSSSEAELVESLVAYPEAGIPQAWLAAKDPVRWANLKKAAGIFLKRYAGAHTLYDGDLTGDPEPFFRHFHTSYGWSPSGLESYRNCGFFFFASRVLRLEPRPEPEEGLDVAQLGTIYHQILEALYASLDPVDRTDPDRLLAALPAVAGPILDQAPKRQGFRVTRWWQQTRDEIEKNIERSVIALAELPGDFIPAYFEARFFGSSSLKVSEGSDEFRLHGVADRVDRDPDGRLRVIDYKSAGPSSYSKRALEKGERLQLPLYALAMRDALGLGEPADGFYWHIYQAKPSDLTLAGYGPEAAYQTALSFAWEAVRGARQGNFRPLAPANGCPSYCPAAGFCWQYRPSRWR